MQQYPAASYLRRHLLTPILAPGALLSLTVMFSETVHDHLPLPASVLSRQSLLLRWYLSTSDRVRPVMSRPNSLRFKTNFCLDFCF